jgi:hypothetical protein
MIHLAGVDEIVASAPADVDAVPLAFVEREAGDGQRLALRAGPFHPVVAASGCEAHRSDVKREDTQNFFHIRSYAFSISG